MRTRPVVILISAIILLLTACAPTFSTTQLYPSTVGDFLRVSGPSPDTDTGVDIATYQGPSGVIELRTREVGAARVDATLSQLPPGALNVGPDPGLGERDGLFFEFVGEFHAAWGNGDWVFVLTADSDAARRNFLNSYGF